MLIAYIRSIEIPYTGERELTYRYLGKVFAHIPSSEAGVTPIAYYRGYKLDLWAGEQLKYRLSLIDHILKLCANNPPGGVALEFEQNTKQPT